MRLKMEFQGKSKWNSSVCKDVRNLKWLVSWNSNNHSSSDRVEWIMSWGVAGGPRRRTWSSLRRGGDLPWERSGEYSMCPNSAESGNRYRCKPPRAPTFLAQSGYWVDKTMIVLYAMNDISNCKVWFMLFLSVALPFFLFVLSVFVYFCPFAMITCVWWEQSRNQVEIPLLSRGWSMVGNVRCN